MLAPISTARNKCSLYFAITYRITDQIHERTTLCLNQDLAAAAEARLDPIPTALMGEDEQVHQDTLGEAAGVVTDRGMEAAAKEDGAGRTSPGAYL